MTRQGTAASASNRGQDKTANRGIAVGYILAALVTAALLALGIALTRALARVPTTETEADERLVGALGTVVIHIPESGSGEVTITQPGQQLRVAAHAEAPIAAGATVVVVDVPSPEAVVVAESGF